MARPWTEEESAVLIKAYSMRIPRKLIARQLKRSLSAIASHAKNLGITKVYLPGQHYTLQIYITQTDRTQWQTEANKRFIGMSSLVKLAMEQFLAKENGALSCLPTAMDAPTNTETGHDPR